MIFTLNKDNDKSKNRIVFGEETLDINGNPYWAFIDENEIRDCLFEPVENAGRIKYARKGGSKILKVKMLSKDSRSIKEELNKITLILSWQFERNQEGYLFVNDWYANTQLVEIKFNNYTKRDWFIELELTFHSDDWTWYKDTKIDYNPSLYQEQHIDLWREYRNYRGYPYGYESNANLNFNIQASFGDYAKAHAIIRLYGNSTNPFISDGIKRGADVTLLDGDYLEINTKNKTVILHKANGYSESVFEKRMMSSDGSIFQNLLLPCTILATKGQKFDMVISEERSSPLWT